MKKLTLFICCITASWSFTEVFSQDKAIIAPVQPVAPASKSTQNAKSSEAGIRAGLQANTRLLPPGINVNAAVYEQYKKSGTITSSEPLTLPAAKKLTAGGSPAAVQEKQPNQKSAGAAPVTAAAPVYGVLPSPRTSTLPVAEAGGYSKAPPPATYTESSSTLNTGSGVSAKTASPVTYSQLPATGQQGNTQVPGANPSSSTLKAGTNQAPAGAASDGGYSKLPPPQTGGTLTGGTTKQAPRDAYGPLPTLNQQSNTQLPGANASGAMQKAAINPATTGTPAVAGYDKVPPLQSNGTMPGAPAVAGYDKVPPLQSNGTLPKQGAYSTLPLSPAPGYDRVNQSSLLPGTAEVSGTGQKATTTAALNGGLQANGSNQYGQLPERRQANNTAPQQPQLNGIQNVRVNGQYESASSPLGGTQPASGNGQYGQLPARRDANNLPASNTTLQQTQANGSQNARINAQYESASSPLGGQPSAGNAPAKNGVNNPYGTLTLKPEGQTNAAKSIYTRAPQQPSLPPGAESASVSAQASNASLKTNGNNQYGSLTLTPPPSNLGTKGSQTQPIPRANSEAASSAKALLKTTSSSAGNLPASSSTAAGSVYKPNTGQPVNNAKQYDAPPITGPVNTKANAGSLQVGQTGAISQSIYTRAPQQPSAQPANQTASASNQASNASLKTNGNNQYGSLTLAPSPSNTGNKGSQTQPIPGANSGAASSLLKATSSSAGNLPGSPPTAAGSVYKPNTGQPVNSAKQYDAPPITGPVNTKANAGATQVIGTNGAATKPATAEKEKLEKEKLQKQRRRTH